MEVALTKLTSLFCFTLILYPLAASAGPAPKPVTQKPAAATAASEPPAKKGAQAGSKSFQKRHLSADAAGAGMLLLRSPADDDAWLAPQVDNEIELRVTGMIARATVEQTFENPSDEVVEAVYVFPLPETAAVDGLTLDVGSRKIVGEIREREEARQTFERAKAEGKKASLLEQNRPNLFTTSVANIGPGEVVKVELRYQQDVRYDSGRFSLAFPATVTPRYIPGAQTAFEHGFSGLGWGAATAQVPDAPRITPPIVLDGGPTLEVKVMLEAGFPLKTVTSASHVVDVTPVTAAGPITVTLRHQEIADRDFLLEWAPEPARAPRSALFEEQYDGDRYAMLMLLPPDAALDPAGRINREAIFVIDTSGSMSGTSIEQAQQALVSGLDKLQTGDTFNVIEFNSTAQRLFDEPVAVTRENVDKARRWVKRLAADGGTEMLSALQLALGTRPAGERLRQVVFITDGSVGNEGELLQYIQGNLSTQRLFTVGIGSAPNQYFMRGAARFGRGTFTNVFDTNEVSQVMNQLWSKIDAPVMGDLALSWKNGPKSETWPERLPDLYRGEPLVVLAKLDPGATAANIVARRAGQKFETELAFGAAASSSSPPSQAASGATKMTTQGQRAERGLHRLWARRKIEGLMDRMIEGTSEAEIQPKVTALALHHHLMSKYTSLVAVDKTRSVDAPGRSVPVANALPAGNQMFGNLPQTATPGPTCLLTSIFSLASALLLRRPRLFRRSAPLVKSASNAERSGA
jgi:Ca-activated chloride channel homolog